MSRTDLAQVNNARRINPESQRDRLVTAGKPDAYRPAKIDVAWSVDLGWKTLIGFTNLRVAPRDIFSSDPFQVAQGNPSVAVGGSDESGQCAVLARRQRGRAGQKSPL